MALIYEIFVDEISAFKQRTAKVSKTISKTIWLQSRMLEPKALAGVRAGSSLKYILPAGQSLATCHSATKTSFDNPVYNIHKAALTQIHVPESMSSGRADILCSLLSQVTGRQELSALIDASDCFDAEVAELAGVNLSRLLWVRCGKKREPSRADRRKKPELCRAEGRRMKPIEQAFKAADILIQNGGLGLIVIDLGGIEERLVRKIPLTTWFRFARVIEKQPTALIVFASYPAAQSCAALTLHIKNPEIHWSTETNCEMQNKTHDQSHNHARTHDNASNHTNKTIHAGPCLLDAQDHGDAQQQDTSEICQANRVKPHTQFLAGLTYEVEVGRVRGQGQKPVQSSVASFAANRWK
jgi:hypothetical protein